MSIKKKSKLPVNIHFLLDRSGSMSDCKKAVIEGFNGYIKNLKNKNVFFSLTTFDTEGLETPYVMTPIKKVEGLNNNNYIPRSGTPLYDAAVNTIKRFAQKISNDQPALIVIMTDGEENSSTEHDQKCFQDLVKKLKERGNWTFVFMGANQDSWANASQYGFSRGAVMDYAFNNAGIARGFNNLAQSSLNYVGRVSATNAKLSTEDFFDKEAK